MRLKVVVKPSCPRRDEARRVAVLGACAGGALAGRRLAPAAHANRLLFAWAAFEPETRIVR